MPRDLEAVRLLADEIHLAVIAVSRPDGSVHASLVSAGVIENPVSGAPSVAAVIVGSARKLGHMRHSGRASATFSSGYRWVSVEGPVRIIGPDDGPTDDLPALLRAVFVAAGGTHDDWDEYDRVMASERRAAVFIEPARIAGIG